MDKTLEILRQTFLFKGIENALDTAALPTPVSFKKGETIYGETDFRRALGILISGKAKATPLSNDKAVLNEGEKRFLEAPKSDELYKVL